MLSLADNIGLHRIENASNVETAVSLHLYCPPFEFCSVYDGKKSFKAKVRRFFCLFFFFLHTSNSNLAFIHLSHVQ